jgi:hypothetical protein
MNQLDSLSGPFIARHRSDHPQKGVARTFSLFIFTDLSLGVIKTMTGDERT